MHYLCLVKPTFSRMCSDALWVITHALNKPLLTKLLFMSKTKQGFHCNKRLLEGLIQIYSAYISVQKPYDNSWLCCWMLNRGFWSSEKITVHHTTHFGFPTILKFSSHEWGGNLDTRLKECFKKYKLDFHCSGRW